MKPSVTLVARHSLSEASLRSIARKLAAFCQSPDWTVSVNNDHFAPVYTFTSTRKNVPLNRYSQCHAYVEGIQFGINHA